LYGVLIYFFPIQVCAKLLNTVKVENRWCIWLAVY